MILEWDSYNPTGDISVIELSLNVEKKEDLSIVPQLRTIANNALYRSQALNSRGKTFDLAEARLELPGLDVKPREIVGQPFDPSGEVKFFWNVTSYVEGDFQGNVWLYVGADSLPKDTTNRYPIAIQPVDFHWQDLFGLSGTSARYLGLFGLIVGILLFAFVRLQAKPVHPSKEN
jgi:hypothetical protein